MSNFKSKINKLFSLSIHDYHIIVKSWILYAKWDWRISKQNYKQWQKHLRLNTLKQNPYPNLENNSEHNFENKPENKSEANVENTSPNIQKIRTIIQLNEIAGRNHYKYMNCLRRCLSQQELLNTFNIETKLHLGVKFVEGKLAAHSWLSTNNQLINDSQEVITTYKELKTSNDQSTLALLK